MAFEKLREASRLFQRAGLPPEIQALGLGFFVDAAGYQFVSGMRSVANRDPEFDKRDLLRYHCCYGPPKVDTRDLIFVNRNLQARPWMSSFDIYRAALNDWTTALHTTAYGKDFLARMHWSQDRAHALYEDTFSRSPFPKTLVRVRECDQERWVIDAAPPRTVVHVWLDEF